MKKRVLVDLCMLLLFVLEFSKAYLNSILHELFGIMLFILFIVHIIFNIGYIKKLFKGKYDSNRVITLIVNVVLFIVFIVTMSFGILSSQDILTFLNINNMNIVKLHKIVSYITFLFMGMHLGINFDLMFNKILIFLKNKKIQSLVFIVIIIFGIYSFIDVDYFNHLIGKYGFSLVNGNVVVNTLEYLNIVMMIAVITNLLIEKGRKNER